MTVSIPQAASNTTITGQALPIPSFPTSATIEMHTLPWASYEDAAKSEQIHIKKTPPRHSLLLRAKKDRAMTREEADKERIETIGLLSRIQDEANETNQHIAQNQPDPKRTSANSVSVANNISSPTIELEVLPEFHQSNIRIARNAYLPDNTPLTVEILKKADLMPQAHLNLEGREVWISKLVQIRKGYKGVIAFVRDDDGFWVPRAWYISQSHNLWKVVSHYEVKKTHKTTETGEPIWKTKRFGKGHSQASVSLPISAQCTLFELFKDQEAADICDLCDKYSPLDIFAGTSPRNTGNDIFPDEQFDIGARSFDNHVVIKGQSYALDDSCNGVFDSGWNLVGPPPKEIKPGTPEMEPETFAKEPDYSFNFFSDSLRCELQAEVYTSQNGELRYLVYRDFLNRVYFPLQEVTGSPVSPTGVYENWVNGKFLATPFMERPEELGDKYCNFNIRFGEYADAFDNYLRHIPLIQRYYREKGITPPTAYEINQGWYEHSARLYRSSLPY